MQWDSSRFAGFTEGTPWLRLAADYAAVNVATLSGQGDSMLSLYRALISLRNSNAALHAGAMENVASDGRVLRYERVDGEQRFAVLLNLSEGKEEASVAAAKSLFRPTWIAGRQSRRTSRFVRLRESWSRFPRSLKPSLRYGSEAGMTGAPRSRRRTWAESSFSKLVHPGQHALDAGFCPVIFGHVRWANMGHPYAMLCYASEAPCRNHAGSS